MKIDEISIEVADYDKFIQTFGGEYDIDEFRHDGYGFIYGGLTVGNIKGRQLARFAVSAINQLMLNGHHFEFVDNGNQDLPVELVIKD